MSAPYLATPGTLLNINQLLRSGSCSTSFLRSPISAFVGCIEVTKVLKRACDCQFDPEEKLSPDSYKAPRPCVGVRRYLLS